jgi:hypothetical protein
MNGFGEAAFVLTGSPPEIVSGSVATGVATTQAIWFAAVQPIGGDAGNDPSIASLNEVCFDAVDGFWTVTLYFNFTSSDRGASQYYVYWVYNG